MRRWPHTFRMKPKVSFRKGTATRWNYSTTNNMREKSQVVMGSCLLSTNAPQAMNFQRMTAYLSTLGFTKRITYVSFLVFWTKGLPYHTVSIRFWSSTGHWDWKKCLVWELTLHASFLKMKTIRWNLHALAVTTGIKSTPMATRREQLLRLWWWV
jgi:hypothetical protein